MNKIDKFLKKLIIEDRVFVLKILDQINSGEYDNLNIKKLKGFDGRYRVRVGRICIFFTRTKDDIVINGIEFRNDNTY